MPSNKKQHGGPGRGQGRHKEPGYNKGVKMRFLSEAEEEAIKQISPRERVEILMAAIASKSGTAAVVEAG